MIPVVGVRVVSAQRNQGAVKRDSCSQRCCFPPERNSKIEQCYGNRVRVTYTTESC